MVTVCEWMWRKRYVRANWNLSIDILTLIRVLPQECRLLILATAFHWTKKSTRMWFWNTPQDPLIHVIEGFHLWGICKVGFTNWKKALERFEKHQNTGSHHEAVDLEVKIPSTTKDVGEMLSASYASQKKENKRMLSMTLSSIRFLGRQGLVGTKQVVTPLRDSVTPISCSYLDYVLRIIQAFSSG